jgi:hypothetical protein
MYLFISETSSYALIQVHLSEIYFSNGQMVNTRSRGGQDVPHVIRAHIANQQNPAPPPLVNQAMDPAMQQFFEAQMQLIQNLTNSMQQMQAQQYQPPQPAPRPPRDRHKEFMSHNPPTFSHSYDLLDADDWLKTITKKLEVVQCTDREMVLYTAGRLVGQARDLWDAYAIAHPNRQDITWQEFRDSFRTYQIPSWVVKLKQKEFLSLRQGSMSVTEYLDKFTHLSRHAPDEVNTNPKRQEKFLDGLIGPLNYQL